MELELVVCAMLLFSNIYLVLSDNAQRLSLRTSLRRVETSTFRTVQELERHFCARTPSSGLRADETPNEVYLRRCVMKH